MKSALAPNCENASGGVWDYNEPDNCLMLNIIKHYLNNGFFFFNNLHSQSLDIRVAEEGAGAEVGVVAEVVEQ